MQRKPISAYCNQDVHGWEKLPDLFVQAYPGEEDFSCGFINSELCMFASVLDFGILNVIHLSLGPIKSFDPSLSDADWAVKIQDNAFSIAESFFPGHTFARQPDDPRKPDVKHYFSVLGADE